MIAAKQKFSGILRKIVFIDEVAACIVGRVNENHLHFAEVALLQKLQGIKVVAFDKQVLCCVEVDALIPARTKGLGYGGVGSEQCLAFAWPIEPITLLRAFDDMIGQCLTKLVEIDGEADSALIVSRFSHAIGE